MSGCRGECDALKGAQKARSGNGYKNGRKVCITCDISIRHEGLRCPCCGGRLRAGSHNPARPRAPADDRCNCAGSIKCTLHGGRVPHRGEAVLA